MSKTDSAVSNRKSMADAAAARKNKRISQEREWDTLPTEALVNIFRRSTLSHRARNLPLVCKSWADASRDPHCWSSMLPAAYSFDGAFVKNPLPFRLIDPPFGAILRGGGVGRLESLIERAHGGPGITTLFLGPFLGWQLMEVNDDHLLRLVARRCPNLKHISFAGSYFASDEALLELFTSCTQLELVDFSDSLYCSHLVMQTMGNLCTHLRGIRRIGMMEPGSTVLSVIQCFPRLRLLNLWCTVISASDLEIIVSDCQELEFLDIRGCVKVSPSRIIRRASAEIAEFLYDCADGSSTGSDDSDTGTEG